MIVFIGLYASFCVLYIEIELLQFLQSWLVDGYTMIPYDYSTIEWDVFDLPAPFMLVDLLDFQSFVGIYTEYLFEKIFELRSDSSR